MCGVPLDGFAVFVFGVFPASKLLQQHGETVMDIRVARLHADSLPVLALGRIITPASA